MERRKAVLVEYVQFESLLFIICLILSRCRTYWMALVHAEKSKVVYMYISVLCVRMHACI